MQGVSIPEKLIKRFRQKYIQGNPEECWEWNAAADSSGYGSFNAAVIGLKTISAHKMAWIISHGHLPPEGIHVLHKCDNRVCVNPLHFFEGTNSDNVADRVKKNRSARMSGIRNPRRILNPCAVIFIRWSKESEAYLSKRFGVAKRYIYRVRAGKTWKAL